MTDILQPVVAVVLVLGLLFAVLSALRRRGLAVPSFMPSPSGRQKAGVRRLVVIERVALGGQHALHLVQVDDRLILVATTQGTCQMLDSAVKVGGGL